MDRIRDLTVLTLIRHLQGDSSLAGAVYGLYAREDIVHPDAGFIKDWEYFNSYEGTKVTQLLNLPQATAEETGRELHRIAKTYRSGAYGTIGTFTGLNLLVRSEYSINGTFDRNTFFVEGTSGLKYRCGLTGDRKSVV